MRTSVRGRSKSFTLLSVVTIAMIALGGCGSDSGQHPLNGQRAAYDEIIEDRLQFLSPSYREPALDAQKKKKGNKKAAQKQQEARNLQQVDCVWTALSGTSSELWEQVSIGRYEGGGAHFVLPDELLDEATAEMDACPGGDKLRGRRAAAFLLEELLHQSPFGQALLSSASEPSPA